MPPLNWLICKCWNCSENAALREKNYFILSMPAPMVKEIMTLQLKKWICWLTMWEASVSWRILLTSRLSKFCVPLIWTIKKISIRRWTPLATLWAIKTKQSILRPKLHSWQGRPIKMNNPSERQWISWEQTTSKPRKTFISRVWRGRKIKYSQRRCSCSQSTRTSKPVHRHQWWTRRTFQGLLLF